MKTAVSILLCVAGFVLLGWVGGPLWGNMVLLRAEISRVNAALSDLEHSKQIQQDLIAAYNAISDNELDLLLNQHLPKKADTGALLVALEGLGRLNNAVINAISFKETAPQQQAITPRQRAVLAAASKQQATTEELMFTLSFSASYENFKAFLRALESHVRLIDIESISFSDVAKQGAYNVSLSAKTYYRK